MEKTMDNKSELVLNKKLAEWAGFHSPFQWKGGVLCDVEDWIYPPSGREMRIPNFTQSLDACFKWLERPVLFRVGVAGWLHILNEWAYEVAMNREQPALTLCLAIEKLIDSEKGIC